MPGAAGAAVSINAARHAREKLNKDNGDGVEVKSRLTHTKWLEEAKEVSVDRLAMLSVLKRRSQRARHFRSAPIAIGFFSLFLAAIVLRRGAVIETFSFEKK